MKQTLASPARFEQEIKGSRFLSLAANVETPEHALQFFEDNSVADATHNCWAYRVGGLYRFNDDGEPGGSAGRPILSAIDGQTLDHVACLVIRWYGGTKLGVGGLVRAYGGTAAECLRNANIVPIVRMEPVAFEVAFDHVGIARKSLQDFGATDIAEDWTPNGVQFASALPSDNMTGLELALNDATRGRIQWNPDV